MNILRLIKIYRLASEDLKQDGLYLITPVSRKKPRGFSLVELMIAMMVGLVVLGALYNLFTVQSKQLGNQEMAVEMQQNARMAMDMMTREIRLAGYNPTALLSKCAGTLPSTLTNSPCIGMLNAADTEIKFNMDVSDTGGSGASDGATDGPNETITYGLYTSTAGGVSVQCLGRKTTNDSSYQPVVEYIDSLTFSYLDNAGITATTIGDIRSIQVSIVAKAAKPDPSYPANGGYRTYTLTSRVTPRNLDY